MNTAQIKAYAPQARRDFIQAVTEKANLFGLSEENIEPAEIKGDVAIIAGRPFSKKVGELQQKMADRIQKDGFDQVMEAAAYTWFNRFAALRYMEVHDYLGHGLRVLSNRGNSSVPEILEHAADVDFQGMDKDKVIELRLAGNKDNDLYRLLIVAQCNALHDAMPFLFEKIDNETELLLPDNLLHSDSTIQKMVTEIDEKDWKDVEIIGWIYQFYISERKNEVIGKVVKSEDIPAATQLFTPNWIVKYMVQNTLGRMWLATYPDSPLRDKMEYYIEPAEQETEVQKQLDAITPKELNPEEITFLDPACGSGHILVEAYNVLKEIYLERGYRTKDIPRLILEKNLYGLDIDDRAAQLACFAVLMKARRDDRRILSCDDLKLHVMAIQETSSFDTEALTKNLLKEKVIRFTGENELFPDFKGQMALRVVKRPEVSRDDVVELLELFHHGKTFGSLITIPDELAKKLPLFARLIEDKLQNGDMFERTAASKFMPVVEMAMILARKYDCVVANPPYMGKRYLNPLLKIHLKEHFNSFEKDLFSAFIMQSRNFAKEEGQLGFMSPFVWMFILSFIKLREKIINNTTLTTLIQLEYSGFAGATVPICTYTFINKHFSNYKGSFIRLSDFRGAENQAPKTLEAIRNTNCGWFFVSKPDDFSKIPGAPIAYWVSERLRCVFLNSIPLSEIAPPRQGLATGDNNSFLRLWYEVDYNNIGFGFSNRENTLESLFKWYPYNKGGQFRKWYGNNEYVVDWFNDGYNIKEQKRNDLKKSKITSNNSKCWNQKYYFQKGITWSFISSAYFGVRYTNEGFIFDVSGSSVFPTNEKVSLITGFLCSNLAFECMRIMNPTLNFQVGNVATLPFLQVGIDKIGKKINRVVNEAIIIARTDWNFNETSWDFQSFPWLTSPLKASTTDCSFTNWQSHCTSQIKHMQQLETENNRLFIEAYSLQDELTPEVPEDQITLARADREADIKRLISYAIGCMMGRYSLDQPGLIYAHSGNEGFDPSKYKTFPADDDGIIPIMDWFPDDATNRFVEFLKVAWSPETLDENLKFITDSLKPKNNAVPINTIQRYLNAGFFKDHLKTYKKRPIYWLFSSGKQKAFECLVYLHRYNESTLSRMRSAYVTPLQGNFNARIEFLEQEKDAAATASVQRKIQKEIDVLKKKRGELSAFDDELRHYADMKISLDLDDGVKVNYDKFGNLLALRKAITGKK